MRPLTSGYMEKFSEADLRKEIEERLDRMQSMLSAAEREKRALSHTEDVQYKDWESDVDHLGDALKNFSDRAEVMPHRLFGGQMETTARAPTGIRLRDKNTGQELRAYRGGGDMERLASVPGTQEGGEAAEFLYGAITQDWRGRDFERRQLTVGGDGGVLVPEFYAREITDLARAQARVLQAGAQTLAIEGVTHIGRVVEDPEVQFPGDEVRAGGITESTMTFGKDTLTPHTGVILLRASVEWMEDSRNGPQAIQNALTQAMALAFDRTALYGLPSGAWSGLRTWGIGATTPINEIVLGTSDGAALTDYSPFVNAVTAILAGNYAGDLGDLAVIMAPRTFGEVELLTSSVDAQPLRPPASYAAIKKLVTAQVDVDEVQGTSSDAATAFVGDFRQLLFGVRTDLRLEISREGSDAFTRLHTLIRAYMRWDWTVLQPKHFARIIGIVAP